MRPVVIYFSILMLLATCGLTGCQVARKSFHIDSNSQTPFFGLNLLPSKSKEKKAQSATYDQDYLSRSRQVQKADDQEEIKQTSGSKYGLSRLKEWFNPLTSTPKHIPLPRTDLASEDEEVDPDAASNDDSVDDF